MLKSKIGTKDDILFGVLYVKIKIIYLPKIDKMNLSENACLLNIQYLLL